MYIPQYILMNNIFKDNSRFVSLVEAKPVKINKVLDNDDRIEKLGNSFKNSNQNKEYSSFNKSYREKMMEKIEKEEIIRKVEEEKKIAEERRVALAKESFPELVNSKSTVVENTINFLEKLKKSVKIDKEVKDVVKPGWTELTLDKNSNNTIMVSNIKKEEHVYVKTAEDLAYDVIEHLVYLHEKRTQEYIDNWGEDEWTNMFTFPNYDYHYFDKLDEIYSKKYSDYESENEEDDEDEYWKKY